MKTQEKTPWHWKNMLFQMLWPYLVGKSTLWHIALIFFMVAKCMTDN